MRTQIPPGSLLASYRIQGPGSAANAVVTCGWRMGLTGELTSAEAQALIAAFDSHMKSMVTNVWTFTGGDVLYNRQGQLVRFEVGRNVLGGLATAPLPPNCAYLAQKQTGLAGRRHRGRFYLPGVAEPDVDGAGVLLQATLTAFQTQLDNWHNASLAITNIDEAVILHSGAEGEPLPPPTPISRFVPGGKIATQRRRMR